MDNNQKLPIGNKMSKVTLLYSLLNASLVQYGIYHEQLSINESIVPYLCRHGTKMFIKGKLIRFCYKKWILHESDNYPYHTIIYSGKEFQVLNVPLNTRVATPTVDVILKA
ncbi:PiggyBac transposable element-derived protein 3 [Trichinella pseudospiralis]|uniref:PiggyBac transposable element-derived protein 3 n=1 Tax=Trichinella pseudospiralis TaxID=6337 RepID=A0A0V1J1L5_TRIPS|nr:PiggyBac transposable element-derived protein 3 [Trichinella pseudospiralis]KRZ28760.1 PiggyBac transposable element-derived protein 3 [Trichinella pseudospiralis]